MYKNTVFICEIDNASSLNSAEPCVVEDEEEEEERLQLREENEERSLGSIFLFGLEVAILIAGIMLYEIQGKTEGQFHIDNNSNINCDLKAFHHLLWINCKMHFLFTYCVLCVQVFSAFI